MLNTERLYIANPYDDDNIELYEEFEKKNEITTKTSTYLKEIRVAYSKEMYESLEKSKNEINQNLYIMKDSKIIDSCYIKAEKDRKVCELFFAPLKIEPKNRTLLSTVSNYVFNILGMEEIFISIDTQDKNLKSNLEVKGFENLGEVNGKLTYLKEKEEIREMKRAR